MTNEKFEKFRVEIVGDLEYQELIADIYYGDQFVAMIHQEKGFNNLEIEIHPPKSNENWVFKSVENF